MLIRINLALALQAMSDYELESVRLALLAEKTRREPPKVVLPALSEDEKRMVQYDMMMAAIKSYRQRNPGIGLKAAKDVCDYHKSECVRLGTFVYRFPQQ